MSNSSKYMIFGSMGVAALVALMSVLDLALGIPFSRKVVMDVMFLIGAGIVLYLGWETWQEMN